MPFRELTHAQLDIFKEISNIGMGHAATALSQMLGHPIHIKVPNVTVAEISHVPELLGGAEKMTVGITLQILGGARGSILLLLPEESAHRLLCNLLGPQEQTLVMNEVNASTLKEVGNILASAYLNALGNMMQKPLIPSVPLLAYDMVGAVVDYVLIDLSKKGDYAMMVDTDFDEGAAMKPGIKGHFFLIPDPATLDAFLDAIGEQHG
jgi:chemotaxis protein CheC